jgi:hypothetical protein
VRDAPVVVPEPHAVDHRVHHHAGVRLVVVGQPFAVPRRLDDDLVPAEARHAPVRRRRVHVLRPEIVVTNRVGSTSGKLTAYDGTGPGFGYAPIWSTTFEYGAEQVEIGDVDLDGWDDVFVHANYSDAVRGFDNDGSGTLTERYTWTGQPSLSGFCLADVGGDGRLDIVEAYGTSPGNIAIAHNTLPANVSRIFGENRYATGAAASDRPLTRK